MKKTWGLWITLVLSLVMCWGGVLLAQAAEGDEPEQVITVTAEPITLTEGINGWYQEDDWFRYYIETESIQYFLTVDDEAYSGTANDIWNACEKNIYILDDQNETHLQVGENPTTIYVDGEPAGEMTIIVNEGPVANITVDDVDRIVDSDGGLSTDADGESFYYYDTNPKTINIEFIDGTSVSGNINEIYEQLMDTHPEVAIEMIEDVAQRETPWELGETHAVTLRAANKSTTYNVNIVESPVEKIEVVGYQDTAILNDFSAGYTKTDYDWDTDTESNGYFYYWLKYDDVVAYFKDGREPLSLIYDDTQGYWWNMSSDQSAANPWGLGQHSFEVSFMGYTEVLPFAVVESPVKSITIEDISLIENADGYQNTWYDGENENSFFVYDYINNIHVTIEYKDGTTVSGTTWEVFGNDISFTRTEDVEQHQTAWNVGETHTVTLYALGASTTFKVTIVPTPVESIKVADLTRVENWDGYLQNSGEENEYFWYDYWIQTITVTLKDGTVLTDVTNEDLWNQFGHSYNVDAEEQSAENPWTVGDHEGVVSFLGVDQKFNIKVIKSPVTSIAIDDVVLTQYVDAYYYEMEDGEYWLYYPYNPTSIKVTLADGTIYEGTMNQIYRASGTYTYPRYYYEGENNIEEPGTYEVNFEFLGFKTTYKVIINASAEKHQFTKKVEDEAHLYLAGTCSQPAIYYYSCEYHDGEMGKGTFYGSESTKNPDNHNWGSWQVVKEPTETEDGLKVRYCYEHEEPIKEEVVIPKGKAPENGYTIIEGANATWGLKTSDGEKNTKGLTVVSDAPFEKYLRVLIDGDWYSNRWFTVESGSTRVTINPILLQDMDLGEHTIEIVSSDGSAKTTFTIVDKEASVTPANNTGNNSYAGAPTGDTANAALYAFLLVVAGAMILAIMKSRKEA